MDWMTTKEAAELWGVKVRQVQTLCERGLVKGAEKKSEVWLLVKSALNLLTVEQKPRSSPKRYTSAFRGEKSDGAKKEIC